MKYPLRLQFNRFLKIYVFGAMFLVFFIVPRTLAWGQQPNSVVLSVAELDSFAVRLVQLQLEMDILKEIRQRYQRKPNWSTARVYYTQNILKDNIVCKDMIVPEIDSVCYHIFKCWYLLPFPSDIYVIAFTCDGAPFFLSGFDSLDWNSFANKITDNSPNTKNAYAICQLYLLYVLKVYPLLYSSSDPEYDSIAQNFPMHFQESTVMTQDGYDVVLFVFEDVAANNDPDILRPVRYEFHLKFDNSISYTRTVL